MAINKPSSQEEQVRFILATGKRLRDHVFHVQSECIQNDPGLKRFRDLTLQQASVAMVTMDRGSVTIGDLAELLNVSPPSASVMVDRLVEKGILERRRSSKDRRKVVVKIAKTAEKHMRVMQQRIFESIQELTDDLGPETTRRWHDVMTRVAACLDTRKEEAKLE